MLRVAINGYGRIGRVVHRQLVQQFSDKASVVAINASSDAAMRAYLLKYDTLHGRFEGSVEVNGEDLRVNGTDVRVIKEREPAKCPWKDLKIDIVVEASGKFRSREKAQAHLTAGAKAVLVTAPPKDDIPMIVRGVNDKDLKSAMPIVSTASCTTNCIAPVIKVLDELAGIASGLVCTTHAYTSSQNLLDNSTDSSKIRIARAANLNIIPSTTGAVKSCAKLFPHLKGKLDGMALRIPVPDVSAAYLALNLSKKTTVEEIHAALRKAANGSLKGILAVEEGQLVSSDYISNTHSSTVDLDSTVVVDGTLVQLLAWYDNEWGYAMRVTEMVVHMGKLL
ncbi:type I glyceraldehyde-3-phosphate dehydrogenase [Candidatus Peregrinibacteria bacterium]|nr:type I glyceraldehyde-3-phosphate dehydrogenase [Candidatus Peregrinibacteria bacterium]